MVARGRVQNGVVVLEEGVRLPEGEEVIVLGPATVPAALALSGTPPHSVLDVPPVTLGRILHGLTGDDDLLGEMLDGRS